MSLTYTQLDKLSKNDIITYALEVQEKYKDNVNIGEKLDNALVEIVAIQKSVEELKVQNIQLESSLAVTKAVNDQLVNRVVELERQVNANCQYSRRECLEISGIPNSIKQDDLESKVCEILSTIDVTVTPSEIEACHRLKNNDRTIVKFCRRKGCNMVLKNKNKLKVADKTKLGFEDDHKIFINESLCPEYRFLFWKCRLLLKSKKIFSYWTFNGIPKIKLSDEGRVYAITHVQDLQKLFPDVDFSKEVKQ